MKLWVFLLAGLTAVTASAAERVALGNDTFKHYVLRSPKAGALAAPILSRVDNRELIYGDGEWIVTGQFLHVGSARGIHHLSFYRASTLRLVAEMEVPNYVFCADWSPERGQFLLVTTKGLGHRMLVKDTVDIFQALIVVDLEAEVVERVSLLGTRRTGDWDYHSSCQVHWRGDRIVARFYEKEDGKPVSYKGKIPDGTPQFRMAPFRDIELGYEKAGGEVPPLGGQRAAFAEAAGLKEAGLTGFSADALNWSSEVRGFLAPSPGGSREGGRLVQMTGSGLFLDLDLERLRGQLHGRVGGAINGLGSLSDGTLCHLDGDEVVFQGLAEEVRVSLREIVPDWAEGRAMLGLGEDALYVVSPEGDNKVSFPFFTIRKDGEISRFPSRVSHEGFYRGGQLNPARESIALWVDWEWKEFSLRTGELASPPFKDQTGMTIGPWGRVFGVAPEGWEITSSCTDAHTGGRAFAIEIRRKRDDRSWPVASGEKYVTSPLHLFEVTASRARLICGGHDAVYLFGVDLATGRLVEEDVFTGVDGADGEVLFDRARRRLFIPEPFGYEIHSLATAGAPEKIADLVLHGDSEFAIVLPNGLYAGSPGCERFLQIPAGEGLVAAAGRAPWRNRPALVLAALGGNKSDQEVLRKVTERWLERLGVDAGDSEPEHGKLPVVSLTEELALRTEDAAVNIRLKVTAGKSQVERVSIRANGVEIRDVDAEGIGVPAQDSRPVEFRVPLSPGQNWIEVVVIDGRGLSSPPLRFRIIRSSGGEGQRYVVSIGVSEYANPDVHDLELAAKDAEDIAAMFEMMGGEGRTRTLVLKDSEVVPEVMPRIREFLRQAKEEDEVIFFGAGHGVLDAELSYVFGAHGLDLERPAESGIELEEIMDAVRESSARRRLILLDTCQAGVLGEREELLLASAKAAEPFPGVAVIERRAVVPTVEGVKPEDYGRYVEELFRLPGIARGLHVIGASSASGFALELKGGVNGVFTSAVIEAVKDFKGDLDGDREVSVEELRRYLDRRVPELTGGAQQPSVVAFDWDQPFVLRRSTLTFPGERFSVTRQRLLTPADLSQFDLADTQYAINELFARHGGWFPKEEIRHSFERFDWYQPREGIDFDQIEGEFSTIEKENLLRLAAHRSRLRR